MMKFWILAIVLAICAAPCAAQGGNGAAQGGNEAGQRDLRRAISRGDLEGVRAALDAGADVNAPNQWGNTPLHLAAFLEQGAIAGLLLERGARADAKNNDGVTPLQANERRGGGAVTGTLIHSGRVDFGLGGENGDTPLQAATRGYDWWAILDYLRQDKLFFERHEVIARALAWADDPRFARTLQACQLAGRTLDVTAMLRNGEASVQGSAANRSLAEIFDDNRSSPVETTGLNPFVVTLRFQTPQTVTGLFIMANKLNAPLHRHRWKVETAVTPEDLEAKNGSYAEATPWIQPTDEEPSVFILARPVQARCFRLTLERLEGGNDVYLTQFRLLTQGEPYTLAYDPVLVMEKPPKGVADLQNISAWVASGGFDANHQLFWRSMPDGAELKLAISLPVPGRYELRARFSQAPNYGIAEPILDGKSLAKVDLWGEQIALLESTLGTFDLTAGPHTLTFKATGKNARSGDNALGLVSLRLVPAL